MASDYSIFLQLRKLHMFCFHCWSKIREKTMVFASMELPAPFCSLFNWLLLLPSCLRGSSVPVALLSEASHSWLALCSCLLCCFTLRVSHSKLPLTNFWTLGAGIFVFSSCCAYMWKSKKTSMGKHYLVDVYSVSLSILSKWWYILCLYVPKT